MFAAELVTSRGLITAQRGRGLLEMARELAANPRSRSRITRAVTRSRTRHARHRHDLARTGGDHSSLLQGLESQRAGEPGAGSSARRASTTSCRCPATIPRPDTGASRSRCSTFELLPVYPHSGLTAYTSAAICRRPGSIRSSSLLGAMAPMTGASLRARSSFPFPDEFLPLRARFGHRPLLR